MRKLRISTGNVNCAVGDKHLSNHLSTFRNIQSRNDMDIKGVVTVNFDGLAIALKY